MIIYMSSLALPQAPAYASEEEQPTISQPADSQASVNTSLSTRPESENDSTDNNQHSLDKENDSDGGLHQPSDTQPQAPEDNALGAETPLEEQKDPSSQTNPNGAEQTTEAEEGNSVPKLEGVLPEADAELLGKETNMAVRPGLVMMSMPMAQMMPKLDYSEDLLITADSDIRMQTPTINDSYAAGAAGTYEPGQDYSPEDDVSMGRSVLYDVSFSFASKAYEEGYVIDALKVVSVDESGQELDLQTPLYWNNGGRTEQMAVIKDIKWQESGFVTGGTAKMSLAVELPQAIYWDTQIAPRIKLIAMVGNASVESGVIELPAVRLSSQAIMTHGFTDGTSQVVIYDDKSDLFEASFNFYSGQKDQADMIGLLDQPLLAAQTYHFQVKAMLDEQNVTAQLLADSFRVQPGDGMTLADGQAISYDADTAMLTVTLIPKEGKAPRKCDTKIYVQVPHALAGEAPHGIEHKVSVTLTPAGEGISFTDFTNQALFKQEVGKAWTTGGALSCPTHEEAAEGAPWFTENIAVQDKEFGTIEHTVSFRNMHLAEEDDITIYQVLPHRIAYLAEGGTLQQKVADQTETVQGVEILYGWSEQLMAFGQSDGGAKTNYKNLQQALQAGTIPLMSYAEVIAQGHYPNIKAFRFQAPELKQDTTITYTIEGSRYVRLPQEQMNRQAVFYEGRLISLVSLPFAGDEQAEKDFRAGLNERIDSLQKTDAKYYLNLGATGNSDDRIERFAAVSVPCSGAQIQDYYDALQLGLYDSQGKACLTVDDYNQAYSLRLIKKDGYVRGDAVLRAGTTVTYELPEQLIPYLSVGESYMLSAGGQETAVETGLDREKHTLTLTLPEDLTFQEKNKDGLYVSIWFAQPAEGLQIIKGALKVQLSGQVAIKLADANKIMDGDERAIDGQLGRESDNYLKLNYTEHEPFYLLTSDKDNQALRLEGSSQYASGESVAFKGIVFNTTQTSNPYYAAFSVPTASYNMAVQGERSVEQGYITAIRALRNDAVIYYQTAAAAAESDRQMLKYAYGKDEALNLQKYYETTVTSSWQQYTADEALPEDVLMFVVYQPDVASGQSLQVAYDVQMAVEPTDEAVYTNRAVMKYFSGGTNMEVWSNQVAVSNIPADPNNNDEKDPPEGTTPGGTDKPGGTNPPTNPDQPGEPVLPGGSDTPSQPPAGGETDWQPEPVTPQPEITIEETPIPLAPQPEVHLEENAVPLAAQPEIVAETPQAAAEDVGIEEMVVPLAPMPGDNPHTGQESGSFWSWLIVALAGLGLSTTWLENRRKKQM